MSSLPGRHKAEAVPGTAWGKDAGPAAAQVTLVPASLHDRGVGFLCDEDLWLYSMYFVKLFILCSTAEEKLLLMTGLEDGDFLAQYPLNDVPIISPASPAIGLSWSCSTWCTLLLL